MRPLLVVFVQPGLGDLTHLLDGFEHVRVEHFGHSDEYGARSLMRPSASAPDR
jgi:hypothetical protein